MPLPPRAQGGQQGDRGPPPSARRRRAFPPPPAAALSVAIPDSCLADESTQLDKSRKVSSIARACAIFGVSEVCVYEEGGSHADRSLLITVLRYAEAPPFLRRRMYRRMNDLKYAGALRPLKIPSHLAPADPGLIAPGDVREGVVFASRGARYADVGANVPVRYRGARLPGERVTLRFKSGLPGLEAREIERGEAGAYWGYRVRARGSLHSLASSWGKGRVILTSRLGRPVSAADVRSYASGARPLLVAFGSTDRGIHDILGAGARSLQDARTLNFFPGQHTETVRLEEAVLGVLSVLRSGL